MKNAKRFRKGSAAVLSAAVVAGLLGTGHAAADPKPDPNAPRTKALPGEPPIAPGLVRITVPGIQLPGMPKDKIDVPRMPSVDEVRKASGDVAKALDEALKAFNEATKRQGTALDSMSEPELDLTKARNDVHNAEATKGKDSEEAKKARDKFAEVREKIVKDAAGGDESAKKALTDPESKKKQEEGSAQPVIEARNKLDEETKKSGIKTEETPVVKNDGAVVPRGSEPDDQATPRETTRTAPKTTAKETEEAKPTRTKTAEPEDEPETTTSKKAPKTTATETPKETGETEETEETEKPETTKSSEKPSPSSQTQTESAPKAGQNISREQAEQAWGLNDGYKPKGPGDYFSDAERKEYEQLGGENPLLIFDQGVYEALNKYILNASTLRETGSNKETNNAFQNPELARSLPGCMSRAGNKVEQKYKKEGGDEKQFNLWIPQWCDNNITKQFVKDVEDIGKRSESIKASGLDLATHLNSGRLNKLTGALGKRNYADDPYLVIAYTEGLQDSDKVKGDILSSIKKIADTRTGDLLNDVNTNARSTEDVLNGLVSQDKNIGLAVVGNKDEGAKEGKIPTHGEDTKFYPKGSGADVRNWTNIKLKKFTDNTKINGGIVGYGGTILGKALNGRDFNQTTPYEGDIPTNVLLGAQDPKRVGKIAANSQSYRNYMDNLTFAVELRDAIKNATLNPGNADLWMKNGNKADAANAKKRWIELAQKQRWWDTKVSQEEKNDRKLQAGADGEKQQSQQQEVMTKVLNPDAQNVKNSPLYAFGHYKLPVGNPQLVPDDKKAAYGDLANRDVLRRIAEVQGHSDTPAATKRAIGLLRKTHVKGKERDAAIAEVQSDLDYLYDKIAGDLYNWDDDPNQRKEARAAILADGKTGYNLAAENRVAFNNWVNDLVQLGPTSINTKTEVKNGKNGKPVVETSTEKLGENKERIRGYVAEAQTSLGKGSFNQREWGNRSDAQSGLAADSGKNSNNGLAYNARKAQEVAKSGAQVTEPGKPVADYLPTNKVELEKKLGALRASDVASDEKVEEKAKEIAASPNLWKLADQKPVYLQAYGTEDGKPLTEDKLRDKNRYGQTLIEGADPSDLDKTLGLYKAAAKKEVKSPQGSQVNKLAVIDASSDGGQGSWSYDSLNKDLTEVVGKNGYAVVFTKNSAGDLNKKFDDANKKGEGPKVVFVNEKEKRAEAVRGIAANAESPSEHVDVSKKTRDITDQLKSTVKFYGYLNEAAQNAK